PTLDFGEAFFTLAIKEGISEIVHVNWNDDINSIIWLISLGDWEEGFIVFTQNSIKCHIPIYAGDMLSFMACMLAHCTTSVTKGRRIILTCF
ncbi:hypothetical protein BD769DRAFT_1372318, partial [Suillus cothurnatus]